MKILKWLITISTRPKRAVNEIVPCLSNMSPSGSEVEEYYSLVLENRPYVRAMREVAYDAFVSL